LNHEKQQIYIYLMGFSIDQAINNNQTPLFLNHQEVIYFIALNYIML